MGRVRRVRLSGLTIQIGEGASHDLLSLLKELLQVEIEHQKLANKAYEKELKNGS